MKIILWCVFGIFVIWLFSYALYRSAEINVNIVNQEFGTHYTADQWIMAQDTIETFILGQKKRLDVKVNQEK